MSEPGLRERARPPRVCPYCRDAAEGVLHTCAGCQAQYHQACWSELGGCGTLGCSELRAEERPETPARTRTGAGNAPRPLERAPGSLSDVVSVFGLLKAFRGAAGIILGGPLLLVGGMLLLATFLTHLGVEKMVLSLFGGGLSLMGLVLGINGLATLGRQDGS